MLSKAFLRRLIPLLKNRIKSRRSNLTADIAHCSTFRFGRVLQNVQLTWSSEMLCKRPSFWLFLVFFSLLLIWYHQNFKTPNTNGLCNIITQCVTPGVTVSCEVLFSKSRLQRVCVCACVCVCVCLCSVTQRHHRTDNLSSFRGILSYVCSVWLKRWTCSNNTCHAGVSLSCAWRKILKPTGFILFSISSSSSIP